MQAWPCLCGDVIVPTAGTLDEHLDAVGQVFDKLIEAGFAVRCDKVHLAMSEVMYLGFLVGVNGTRPHPSKTQALLDMAVEDMGTDPSAAARYAGMLGFYSKFIPNLHVSLAPFHELKAKGANAREIMSTLRFKAAFEHTKNQLANATAHIVDKIYRRRREGLTGRVDDLPVYRPLDAEIDSATTPFDDILPNPGEDEIVQGGSYSVNFDAAPHSP